MWKPISREEIEKLIAEELSECSPEQQELFNSIKVDLKKWQLEPWGNEGGGFWVVAKTPGQVLWYNDIEDGFNWSSCAAEGVIGEYWCNQDELRHALYALHHPTMKLGAPQSLR
jgi:hypothetical protein